MYSRKQFLYQLSALGALSTAPGFMFITDSIRKRPIPSTGESIPVVGVGTWQTFDVGTSESDRAPLKDVLQEFIRLWQSN